MLDFTPNYYGKCSISVKLDGRDIQGSPMTFEVSTFDFFGFPKQFRLLYDANIHGYSNALFKQHCGRAVGTVVLVTLRNGAKFGGFNPGSWAIEGNGYEPDAFLFSLTNGKGGRPQKFKLNGRNNQCAVNANFGGPTFGGFTFIFFLSFLDFQVHFVLNLC